MFCEVLWTFKLLSILWIFRDMQLKILHPLWYSFCGSKLLNWCENLWWKQKWVASFLFKIWKQTDVPEKKKVKNTNTHARMSFLGKSGNSLFRPMCCTTVQKGRLSLSTIWPWQGSVWSHVLKDTVQCKMELLVPDSHVRDVTENWKSCPYLSSIVLSRNNK